MTPAADSPNCPFYGHHMFLPAHRENAGPYAFMLMEQRGNQCALVVTGYMPCLLELNGESIDWRVCPRVRDIRGPFQEQERTP